MPKISVLLPVYNAENFIAQTVESIMGQSFEDWELIIINDASTDHSGIIIKQFEDSRIRYLEHQHNQGISQTRNELLSLAAGEYLAIIDHDDLMRPHRLEKQNNFLDQHPEVAAVGTYFQLIDTGIKNNQREKLKQKFVNLGWEWHHPLAPTIADAFQGCPLMHPTAMIRRSFMEENQIKYRTEFSPAEDYALFSEILLKGGLLANLPRVLTDYNWHGNNFSVIAKEQMRQASGKVKQMIRANWSQAPQQIYPYWKIICQKLRLHPGNKRND